VAPGLLERTATKHMQEIFDAPEWFEALTLVERAALLGCADGDSPVDGDPPAEGNPPEAARRERAARTVARWRRESGLLDDRLFAERLGQDGLTPDRLVRVLAETAAGLRRRTGGQPGWLRRLARAYAQPLPSLSAPIEEAGGLGLLELWRPLIADAHARLLGALRTVAALAPAALDPAAVAAALLSTLLERLRRAGERTLVLELHASRLEGRLAGETPEQRFASFVAIVRDPAAGLEILRRYPVLARDGGRCADQWVAAGLETIERLAADRDDIVRRLAAPGDPGPAVAARAGLGDFHAGGRSVTILTFASGLQVVYKPRSLAIDFRFQELVGWLNERGVTPPLRALAVLDRGSHGWMEHAAAAPCRTPAEVARFHERQGAWVALLYALEATDFHWENLIAAGEHPALIDLETLLQGVAAEPVAGGPGWFPVEHTVLRSGLLPRRFWAGLDLDGLDLSGMGAAAGQAVEIGRVTEEGTDEMRWGRRQEQIGGGPQVPTLGGEPVRLWEHGAAVLRGFRSTHRLLRRHRRELADWLATTADLPTRALVRPTSAYAHLLHIAHHPDYLRSALDRDRLYDRLWTAATDQPRLRTLLRLEREDLAAGDIPRFLSSPRSTELLHPGGGRIEGFFARSGLRRAGERLAAADEADLERQGWLVKAAIEATRPLAVRRLWPRKRLPEAEPAEPERFLAAARRVGDRLARLAVEEGGRVTWFHLEVGADGWQLEQLPASLYSGLAGIALFLAHLGRLAGEERYERLARLALATARWRLETDPEALRGLGAFSGWGGAVYAFTHLGLLWREPALLDEAAGFISRMAPLVEPDQAFDVIAGSAGGAAALLALYRHHPSAAVLDLAVDCGDRLVAGAMASERGLGWPALDGMSRRPLTGFGHGTAGIAWALAALAHAAGVAGAERFRHTAREALRYERSWFDAGRGNWPDLRESRATGGGPAFFHSWCHGAPGIGLGRVGSLATLADPEMVAEIRAAVGSTLAEGFGSNHCLCHGDLGNLELVREAGRVLAEPRLCAEAGRLAARILARIEGAGPRCGASIATELPGLLAGLAGIGYGLLRAAFPERVPCVLLLEPPT
jgi:type 2 lantibiotic biosynthesis protein LanM